MQLQLSSLKGLSHNVTNCIARMSGTNGIVMIVNNCLKYFDEELDKQIYKTDKSISTMAINGMHICLGEKRFKGELTYTYFLNLAQKDNVIRYQYQKTTTEMIDISKNSRYICTVGNSDENQQQICIIDTKQISILGTTFYYVEKFNKAKQPIVDIKFSNQEDGILIILFKGRVEICYLQPGKQIKKFTAKASKVRQFTKVVFAQSGESCLICSKNGDITEISLKNNKQARVGPRKRVIIGGIILMKKIHNNRLIITSKNGFIALLQYQDLRIIKQATLKEQILTITQVDPKGFMYIATKKSTIYKLNTETLDATIFYACHSSPVNSISFVQTYSLLYATCAGSQIFIWNTYTAKPIFKIELPKSLCHSIAFTRDGNYLISGWQDDCIRIFAPANGKQLLRLQKCHMSPITCVTSTLSSDKIISGGQNGTIRVWLLQKKKFGVIEGTLLFHRKKINALRFCQQITSQFASGSEDGCFAIWNLSEMCLMSSGQVSNFVKDIWYESNFTVRIAGSSSEIFNVYKNNGKPQSSYILKGSHINTFQKIQYSQQQILVAGGELPQILVYDIKKKQIVSSENTYGSVTKLVFSPNHKILIVGTEIGAVLSFKVTNKFIQLTD